MYILSVFLCVKGSYVPLPVLGSYNQFKKWLDERQLGSQGFSYFFRDASSETTKEAPVETFPQPTPQPSEGPSEPSKGPSDQSAADPTEGPVKDVPAGPTVQAEEETTGQSSDPTPIMVTVETGGQDGTDQPDSAPHSNQVRFSDLHLTWFVPELHA